MVRSATHAARRRRARAPVRMMLTKREIAFAFYLVLTSEADTTDAWRRFRAWWKRSPENRQAMREIEDEQRELEARELAAASAGRSPRIDAE